MEKVLVSIGKVLRPHGIRGKIKVEYFGDDLSTIGFCREVLIQTGAGDMATYQILEAVPQPPQIILTLKGIEKKEDTQPLLRGKLFVKREVLPKLGENEFYWVDLLGMEVLTEGGTRIGELKEIFPTGANDVFVVAGRNRDIFLPATEEVIKGIDLEGRRMVVRWMEGLWEVGDEV